jgi:hypothetical protein
MRAEPRRVNSQDETTEQRDRATSTENQQAPTESSETEQSSEVPADYTPPD